MLALNFPMRRITVNLAPAELPKQGGRYDLPIAVGILAASGQIPPKSLELLELANCFVRRDPPLHRITANDY